MDPKARQLRKKLFKISLFSLGGILVLVLVGVSLYFYGQYRHSQALLAARSIQKDPAKEVIAAVSSLMQLPTGEDPTVATVTNAEDLKKQRFFQNAKNGDKVLIYSKAKRAILFRPSTNKIVDVAPINLSGNTSIRPGSVAGAAITPSLTPTPTAFVFPTATQQVPSSSGSSSLQ